MTNERYAHICLRLGLLASAITLVFWGIWSVYAPVPDHGTLKVTSELTLTIPLNRWWDVLFSFLLVNVYGWMLRLSFIATPSLNKEDFLFGLWVGLGAGLGAGIGAGIWAGLVAGLVVILGVGLVGILVAILVLVDILGVGPGVSLGVGLGVCLGACLGVCLVTGLGVGLGVGLVAVIQFFCVRAYPFFSAADKT